MPETESRSSPKRTRRRRKDARPAEIVEAAEEVFAARGFAAATLDEVARKAGVAKGTLYLYFDTKEDLFRAVVRRATEPVTSFQTPPDLPLVLLVPTLLGRAAEAARGSRLPAIARIVIGESRAIPGLARIWHDDVVSRLLDLLAEAVARAQARGEAKPGDPRLHALSIAGALLAGLLYREVFGPLGVNELDLPSLARQHAETVLSGLLTPDHPQKGAEPCPTTTTS